MSVVAPIRSALSPIKVLKPTVSTLTRPSVFNKPQQQRGFKMSSTQNNEIPTFGFKERQPTTEEKQLIDDVLNLYQLRPISTAYARYAPTATFHDPIGLAEGLEAVKAQFNSMPSLFSESVTKGMKVLDNPAVKPPSVQFSLSQDYKFKFPPTNKLVNSLITLKVDPSTNLITHHEEEWDGQNNSTSEDGFFGKINEARKKFTAEAVKMAADTRPIDQQK